MRTPLILLALAAASTPAIACNPQGPTPVSEVATRGVVIRGTLIQAFDAEKEQPEIIRADEVFIGDDAPRVFVIYRHPSAFEAHLAARQKLKTRHRWVHSMCEPPNPGYSVGHVFDRLILLPAWNQHPSRYGNEDASNGRWKFDNPDTIIPSEHLLRMLVDEASKAGRFRSRPPETAR